MPQDGDVVAEGFQRVGSDRRATQSVYTSGKQEPPGCLDVVRGSHPGQRQCVRINRPDT